MEKYVTFTTTLDCEFLGEVYADVKFEYLPEEPEILWPVDDAHPGCEADADIIDVIITINGIKQSVISMVPEFYIEELAERAIDWFNNSAKTVDDLA